MDIVIDNTGSIVLTVPCFHDIPTILHDVCLFSTA